MHKASLITYPQGSAGSIEVVGGGKTCMADNPTHCCPKLYGDK